MPQGLCFELVMVFGIPHVLFKPFVKEQNFLAGINKYMLRANYVLYLLPSEFEFDNSNFFMASNQILKLQCTYAFITMTSR